MTGLTFAKSFNSFRSLTIGLLYPSTLCEGEETAPNIASPVHSFFKAATVSWGSATPVFWKCSKPACKGKKDVLGSLEDEEEDSVSSTRCAACQLVSSRISSLGFPEFRFLLAKRTGKTTLPMPSPGIMPMTSSLRDDVACLRACMVICFTLELTRNQAKSFFPPVSPLASTAIYRCMQSV